jgi:hypothetical protein
MPTGPKGEKCPADVIGNARDADRDGGGRRDCVAGRWEGPCCEGAGGQRRGRESQEHDPRATRRDREGGGVGKIASIGFSAC